MKFRNLIFLVIICGLGYYIFTNSVIIENTIPVVNNVIENVKEFLNNDSPQEKEMSAVIKENDLERLKIEDGDSVFIRFSSDSILNLNQLVYNVAMEAYDIFQKPLVVEAYFLEEPVLRLKTNNPNEEASLFFTDIRSYEFMVENDIMIFDVLVETVEVHDDVVSVEVEYVGPEEDFFDDYAGMSFVIVQDVPWVQDIIIIYHKEDLCLSMKTTSMNVLNLFSEDISRETFLGNLDMEKCGTEKIAGVDENINVDNIGDDVVIADGGLKCSTDVKEAYQQYMQAYNKMVYLMERHEEDTPEAKTAYIPYKFYKDCWDAINPDN